MARVTDLSGTAELLENDQAKNLRILTRVRAGNRISLAPGGSLTLHFPGNRTDFRFQGPDTIRIEDQQAISETSTAETRTHSDIGVELNLADTDLGAIAMRSLGARPPPLKILGPSDTRVLMAKPVVFRWKRLGGLRGFSTWCSGMRTARPCSITKPPVHR